MIHKTNIKNKTEKFKKKQKHKIIRTKTLKKKQNK